MEIVLPIPEQCMNSPTQLPWPASNMQAGFVLWKTWADILMHRQWLMQMRLNENEDSQATISNKFSNHARLKGLKGKELQEPGRSTSARHLPWSAEPLVIADHDQHFCCLHLCLHNIAYMQPAYLWKSISLQSAFLSSMDPSIYVPTYVPTYPSIHLIYLHLSLSLSLSLSMYCVHACNARQRNALVM